MQCRRQTQETQVQSLGWEDPLEEDLATHSSTPAWRIPWTEELGGLLWRVHGVAKELDMTATKQQLQTNETLGELTSLVVLVTFQTLDGHLRPLVTSCTLQIIEHICHHRKFYIQY